MPWSSGYMAADGPGNKIMFPSRTSDSRRAIVSIDIAWITCKFPAQIHSCKGAVRWLRANADKYNSTQITSCFPASQRADIWPALRLVAPRWKYENGR